MARSMSAAARRALFSSETGEVIVALLTLTHPQIAEPIRIAGGGEDLTVGPHVYRHFPFDLLWPDDVDDAPPRATLRVDNVDRRMVEAVRSVAGGPISVSLSLVLASSPETIEAGPVAMKLYDVRYDATAIEGDLEADDVLNEPYPAEAFTPANFPALF